MGTQAEGTPGWSQGDGAGQLRDAQSFRWGCTQFLLQESKAEAKQPGLCLSKR